MITTKKGVLEAFGIIITFSLVSILMIFSLYFIFVMGNNYIAVPLTNITNVTNFDPMINTGIQEAGESYQNTNLDMIDNGFLLGLIALTSMGLMLAYKSRNLNYFTFLNLLTYGLMFVLFIISIIELTTNWIYDILINLFPTMIIDLPVFNWFMENIGIYSLILLALMLLINQLDFDLSVINRRKDKEMESFDDEMV